MILALILASWMWDRVITSCTQGQEQVDHYYFNATVIEFVPSWCQDVSTGEIYECWQSLELDPVPFGPNISDPGYGDTVSTDFNPVDFPELLPDPTGVNMLVAWPWKTSVNDDPVVAVDLAGNRSDQSCP